PQFTNNFSIRYNNFSFATGNVFFVFLGFQQTNNQVVTNSVTYPRFYAPDPRFSNTVLTEYLNANGHYNINGFLTWSKPWDNRKYTLSLRSSASYANNVGYLTNIDSVTYAANMVKNIGK